MLAVFCLRLALGLVACLLLVPRRQTHPRYYRTHHLTALGLAVVALAFQPAGARTHLAVGTAAALALAASVVWRLEGAPGGQLLNLLTAAALAAALVQLAQAGRRPLAELLAGDFTSAALLGTALSAMLMGHFYLIAPGMPLAPLLRLLAAFAVALLLRAAADGYALWHWASLHSPSAAGNEALLFLLVRWFVGLALPALLAWMARESARTSTQSATGILYVVVIFCFLGELTALLLRDRGLAL